MAALGVGSYAVYWLWKNGYFDDLFSTGCKLPSDCQTGYACISGKCVKDTGCTTSNDCLPGYTCNAEHNCVPATGCTTDTDCPTGQHCNTNGVCVQCLNDTHCQLGYKCTDGQCVSSTFDLYGISHWSLGEQIRGVLGGVSIKATNLSTNEIWQTVSDANGNYRLESIPEGYYSFEATKDGYYQLTDFPWVEWNARTGYRPGYVIPLPDIYTMMEEYFAMNIDVSGLTDDYTISFASPHYLNHVEGTITFDCGWGFSSEHSQIIINREPPKLPIVIWATTSGSPQSFDVHFPQEELVTSMKFMHDCYYAWGQGKGLKSINAIVEREKI